jgi:hypothetical protein
MLVLGFVITLAIFFGLLNLDKLLPDGVLAGSPTCVTLPARSVSRPLSWPSYCPCCAGPVDSEMKLRLRSLRRPHPGPSPTLTTPYCTACRGHLRGSRLQMRAAKYSAFPYIWMCGGFLWPSSWLPGMLTAAIFAGPFVAVLACILWAGRVSRTRISPHCTANDVALVAFLWPLRFANPTTVAIVFRNKSYAGLFAACNPEAKIWQN